MSKFKKRETDFLTERRKEILAEYRYYQLDPVRIGTEPISLELALLLELIVPVDQPAREAV